MQPPEQALLPARQHRALAFEAVALHFVAHGQKLKLAAKAAAPVSPVVVTLPLAKPVAGNEQQHRDNPDFQMSPVATQKTAEHNGRITDGGHRVNAKIRTRL